MAKTVMCKFYVGDLYFRENKAGEKIQVVVKLWPVTYSSDNPEHQGFAKATPSGSLELTIDNPACFDFFKVGKHYYLPITEAEG